MPDEKEALKRLSAIRDGGEGYAAAIMDAYGFLPVGQFYADLETLIAAAQRGAGEGFVLVPREPTREMWAAAGDAFVNLDRRRRPLANHDKATEVMWKAMLSASPPQGGDNG